MQRRRALVLLGSTAVVCTAASQTCPADHNELSQSSYVPWVAEALKRMSTIKPSMTRKDLFKVFTTEGGISTRTWRKYVSQECPYFKVDVEFKPVGRPDQLEEGNDDIILKISRPYLEFSIMD